MRLREGGGRAGAQAADARPAQGRAQRGDIVGIKGLRGQQLAQEEVAATARVDEHGVLADEAQPGAEAVAAFEQRPGVDIGAPRRRGTRSSIQPIGQRFQTRQHDIVIIDTPGVAGDAPARRIAQQRFVHGCAVVQADDDDRAYFGQDEREVAAARDAIWARHVAHLAVHPGGDPAFIGVQKRRRLRPHDADGVEAECERSRFQL